MNIVRILLITIAVIAGIDVVMKKIPYIIVIPIHYRVYHRFLLCIAVFDQTSGIVVIIVQDDTAFW